MLIRLKFDGSHVDTTGKHSHRMLKMAVQRGRSE